MAFYYCASTGAFYDTGVVSEVNIPADKVQVIEDEYRALIDAQNNGYVIVPGESGAPTLLEQQCDTCTCTVHEMIEASAEQLGHLRVDDTPTLNSNNAVSSHGIKTALNDIGDNVVHRSGDEVINGAKTFKGDLILSKSQPVLEGIFPEFIKGDTLENAIGGGVRINDGSGATQIGGLDIGVDTANNARAALVANSPVAGSTDLAEVKVVYPATGVPYAVSPTPPATASGNEIVTAAWLDVKLKDYVVERGNGTFNVTTVHNCKQLTGNYEYYKWASGKMEQFYDLPITANDNVNFCSVYFTVIQPFLNDSIRYVLTNADQTNGVISSAVFDTLIHEFNFLSVHLSDLLSQGIYNYEPVKTTVAIYGRYK